MSVYGDPVIISEELQAQVRKKLEYGATRYQTAYSEIILL